jgi:predicted metal-dependent phosphoesterase TrpH
MSRADPHCHTFSSDGMVTPAQLVAAAVGAKLDLIAVTDHDTMDAVKEAQQRGEEAGILVVAGQEVTTRPPAQTHVMGWFLSRPIKRGMSLEDTVDAIHDQGGLAIVPHPFMPVYFASIQPAVLRRLIETHPVDGIEMAFTAPIGRRRRRELDAFYAANRERLGAAVGGSDCHFGVHDIGLAVTEYDGDFRHAVIEHATRAVRLSKKGAVPLPLAARQQWRSLIELPVRRLRGDL